MNTKKIRIMLLCTLLFILTGCSSDNKSLNGKYVSTFGDGTYYNFDKNGNYSSNQQYDESVQGTTGKYTIDDDGLITIQISENHTSTIGYFYKNYICSLWTGVLPKNNNDETIITCQIGVEENSLQLSYTFNNDGTFAYNVNTNDEVVETKLGTYSVEDERVVCVEEDNIITTFINTENGVYSIDYSKE